jgi:hypothetical protein
MLVVSVRQGVLWLNGHTKHRLPNTLNVRFPRVSGDVLLSGALEITASAGSACQAQATLSANNDDVSLEAARTAKRVRNQTSVLSLRKQVTGFPEVSPGSDTQLGESRAARELRNSLYAFEYALNAALQMQPLEASRTAYRAKRENETIGE